MALAEIASKKSVTIRKVTRGSPDSDDSFDADSPEGYLGGRDDQFLVSDRSENKFYGNYTVDNGYQSILFIACVRL